MHKFTITDTICYDDIWLPDLGAIPAVIEPPMYYGGEPEVWLALRPILPLLGQTSASKLAMLVAPGDKCKRRVYYRGRHRHMWMVNLSSLQALLPLMKDKQKMEWASGLFKRKVCALEMLYKGDAKTSVLYHYDMGSAPVPAEEYGCEAGTLARAYIGLHRRCKKLEEMLEQVENGA